MEEKWNPRDPRHRPRVFNLRIRINPWDASEMAKCKKRIKIVEWKSEITMDVEVEPEEEREEKKHIIANCSEIFLVELSIKIPKQEPGEQETESTVPPVVPFVPELPELSVDMINEILREDPMTYEHPLSSSRSPPDNPSPQSSSFHSSTRRGGNNEKNQQEEEDTSFECRERLDTMSSMGSIGEALEEVQHSWSQEFSVLRRGKFEFKTLEGGKRRERTERDQGSSGSRVREETTKYEEVEGEIQKQSNRWDNRRRRKREE